MSVASSISVPPTYLFQFTLLTLLCLEQADQVPIPTERPRKVSDVFADLAPMGHAPWMRRVLPVITEDQTEGARPLPWITPSLVADGGTLTWTSSGNSRMIRTNKNLAFCPGAVIDGIAQPFVVGTGAINSPVCQSILVSIANPRVYHSALQSGSDSTK